MRVELAVQSLGCSHHNVVELCGVDFAGQGSALNLDEPRVLEGVAPDGPVDLAEHGVAPELEAGQHQVALGRVVAVGLVHRGLAAPQDHRRQLELQPGLAVVFVHLEDEPVSAQERARGVQLAV